MCKNKALCDKIKEIIKTNIESWLYDKMCIGCELERRCHINCEHCDEFEENLYCIENNEDCEYFQDFYGFDFDDDLDEEEKEDIINYFEKEKIMSEKDKEIYLNSVKQTKIYQETREYLIWCQNNGQNPSFATSLINYRGVVRKCKN